MRKPTLSRSFSIFVAAVFIIAFPRSLAPATPPDDGEINLAYVHGFLQLFYPEFMIKGNTLKLMVYAPADDSLREIAGVYFTLAHTTPPNYVVPVLGPDGKLVPGSEPDPGSSRVLLEGSMWVPFPQQHGRIAEVVALDGAHTEKMKSLEWLVRTNPQWTKEQVMAALKQAGARFGPNDKEEFLTSLPLARAERFLGRLRILSVDPPSIPDERGEGVPARLDWRVKAEATFPDGTKSTYDLAFEPFEGKLLLASRR
jgi:hypothetical protein